jgi:hypothetical protein
MFSLLLFIIIFAVMYFVYYFIFDDKLKKEKYTKISELVLLTNRFKLDKKKMDYKSALNGIAIINAFIISFTIAMIDFIPLRMELKLVVAFFIICALLITLYFAYGSYLHKKWGRKDDGV